MEHKVNSGIWGAMFGVPNIVADNFLKLATGGQLKVLLYLLRSSGRTVTEKEIAANTGISEQEAADAVLFWQQANILTGAESAPAAVPMMKAPAALPEAGQVRSELRRVQLQPSEIAELMKNSGDITELFRMSESVLGGLNHSQQNSIIQMYDYFGLKKEVICTLVCYCSRIDKTNGKYMEKVAESWVEKGIDSLEAAQKEVQRLTRKDDLTHTVMKMFELDRHPTTKQAEYISKWVDAGFSTELIKYAYEKNIDNTNKLSFPYIDKVLSSWRSSGYMTVREVQAAEEEYRKKSRPADKSGGVPSDIDKYNVVINKF